MITDANVTTAKITDDAVTADKLANTAVTAGSYTTTSLTVDAQGRITAASSGAAGGAGYLTLAFTEGPSSGNVALAPQATKVQAFLFSGGGGGGGASGPDNISNGNGGPGAFGFYAGPATGGSTIAYSAGGGGGGGTGGDGGTGNPGSDGGATTFHNFTANGVLVEVEHQVIREPLETHQDLRLTYHQIFYLVIKEDLQVLEGITPQDPVVLAVLVVFGYYQMKDNLWHI
jgi:hypothetical protein